MIQHVKTLLIASLLAASALVQPVNAQLYCSAGPFVIYFEADQSRVTAGHIEILNAVLKNDQYCDQAIIEVSGHIDRRERPQLGLDRAATVSHFLIAHGIDQRRVFLQDFAATKPAATAMHGEAEARHNRVEIRWAPSR